MSSGTDVDKATNKNNKSGRLQTVPNWLIIILLILFFPVGIYLVWQQPRWSKHAKKIITWIASIVLLGFLILITIFAPPSVTINSSLASVKSDSYTLTGKVYPAESVITVNDKQAKVTDDTFTVTVQLKEGDNILKVVTTNGTKHSSQDFKIHRYTKAEITAQENAAAKKRADTAAKAAKKKAADAAAAQVKQQQAAEAKAKADTEAAAKAAQDKIAADAAAKAKALASATVSQKNALSKAKEYLNYTAFSHDGLVDQLVYEKFSTEDATYGADNVGADWNAQAAKKAKEYLSYSSFSRGGLIDQLLYEKFTEDQAIYGVDSVGL